MGNWIDPIDFRDLALWRDARENRAWPTPNTLRAFGGYWFPRVGTEPAPIASHYLLRFDYQNDQDTALWVDHICEPTRDFETYSDSGVNDLGQRLQLFVRDVAQFTAEPSLGGVEWEFVYDRDGFADTVRAYLLWPTGGPQFGDHVPFAADHPRPQAGGIVARWLVEGEDGDTDWTVNSLFAGLGLLFWAAPERFDIPASAPIETALAEENTESNGTDGTAVPSTLGGIPVAAETAID